MDEYPFWFAFIPQLVVNMALILGFYHWGYHKGKRSRDED